jgi:hypothetical protein
MLRAADLRELHSASRKDDKGGKETEMARESTCEWIL